MKSCYKAGLIRVITLPDAEAAGIHGRLIMEMFPNMTVEKNILCGVRSKDKQEKAAAVSEFCQPSFSSSACGSSQ